MQRRDTTYTIGVIGHRRLSIARAEGYSGFQIQSSTSDINFRRMFSLFFFSFLSWVSFFCQKQSTNTKGSTFSLSFGWCIFDVVLFYNCEVQKRHAFCIIPLAWNHQCITYFWKCAFSDILKDEESTNWCGRSASFDYFGNLRFDGQLPSLI